jgi:hypothetical protein
MDDFLRALFGDDVPEMHIVDIDPIELKSLQLMVDVVRISSALDDITTLMVRWYNALADPANDELLEATPVDLEQLARFILRMYNTRIHIADRMIVNPSPEPGSQLTAEKEDVLAHLRFARDRFFDQSILNKQ